MKPTKPIIVILSVVISLAGCSGGDKSELYRPYQEFQKYTVKRFKGEKLTGINVDAAKDFRWNPGVKGKGVLRFRFQFTTEDVENRTQRKIRFKTESGRQTFLDIQLDKDQFVLKGDRLLFRKDVNIPVSLKKGETLTFCMEDTGGTQGDTFDLINLHLVPDRGDEYKKHRNVLLITIDTLRADYLGYFRKLKGLFPEKISFSPVLDQLAGENLVFTSAYTPISSTWPALTSIARSRMPHEHGIQFNGDEQYEMGTSLGHLLFKERYSVSFRANAFQLEIGGFDEVRSFFRKDKKLKESAKQFLSRNYNRKFFMWLHFLGVHAGYRPPKDILKKIEPDGYTGNVQKAVGPVLKKITAGEKKVTPEDIEHIRNCYAGELIQIDAWIGEIFDVMKERGIWENTLVIVSADHGEDLYDHNRHFFHHPSIYNTSLHVPLIMKFPGSEFAGTIDENVSIMDFMPTILDFLGVETEYRMSGESLMPLIRGDRKRKNRVLIAESEKNKIMAVIGDQWKMIYNPESIVAKTQYGNSYFIDTEEFYNIDEDRLEQVNLLKKETPNIYKKMKYTLLNYIKTFQLDKEKRARKKVSEMSEEVKKELRSLGYL